ncbi:hypothetical protein PG994_014591 [Apiospora phragmitis]|uniref:DUF6546 domain-containing protein n=1 Tax=Apiospora phragmitis TaxID=2905665 RepID=A0ABR1T6V4_9PEZI
MKSVAAAVLLASAASAHCSGGGGGHEDVATGKHGDLERKKGAAGGALQVSGAPRYNTAGPATTITWRGTWELTMEPCVIQALEAVVHRYGGWSLNIFQKRLDEADMKSLDEAIHHLMLSGQVIRPISLQQIRIEQKALQSVQTV